VELSVKGYVKRWQKTGEIFEEVPLSMPNDIYGTRACWVDLPTSCVIELARRGLSVDAGLHAVAHAVLSLLPLCLSCETADVGWECDELSKCSLWPKRLLFFDRAEGGLGICERAHESLLRLLGEALQLMRDCPCSNGCYCCVHSTKCTEYNANTDKEAAILIAELVLEAASKQPSASVCSACTPSASETAQPAREHRVEGFEQHETALCVGTESETEPPSMPPSMLGASIRRLKNIASAQGAERRKINAAFRW
jgi:ATP-dependent helicase YprA (DUF1998 family)